MKSFLLSVLFLFSLGSVQAMTTVTTVADCLVKLRTIPACADVYGLEKPVIPPRPHPCQLQRSFQNKEFLAAVQSVQKYCYEVKAEGERVKKELCEKSTAAAIAVDKASEKMTVTMGEDANEKADKLKKFKSTISAEQSVSALGLKKFFEDAEEKIRQVPMADCHILRTRDAPILEVTECGAVDNFKRNSVLNYLEKQKACANALSTDAALGTM